MYSKIPLNPPTTSPSTPSSTSSMTPSTSSSNLNEQTPKRSFKKRLKLIDLSFGKSKNVRILRKTKKHFQSSQKVSKLDKIFVTYENSPTNCISRNSKNKKEFNLIVDLVHRQKILNLHISELMRKHQEEQEMFILIRREFKAERNNLLAQIRLLKYLRNEYQNVFNGLQNATNLLKSKVVDILGEDYVCEATNDDNLNEE